MKLKRNVSDGVCIPLKLEGMPYEPFAACALLQNNGTTACLQRKKSVVR